MARSLILSVFCIFLYASAYAAVELDADHNGAVDIGKGGSNATSAALARINIGAASSSDLALKADLAVIYTQAQIDTMLGGYATTSALTAGLAGKADASGVAIQLGSLSDIMSCTDSSHATCYTLLSSYPTDKTRQSYTASATDSAIAAALSGFSSGGTTITAVTTNPTASSASGLYVNTSTYSLWSKDDNWLCQIGVSCQPIYTVAISTPENGSVSSATLNVNCPGDCTRYSLPQTITDWVFTPNSGYTCSGITGFDSGNCTAASLVVSSDKTVSATFALSGGGGACSESTDYIGYKTVGGTSADVAVGYGFLIYYPATCPSGCSTGNFITASLYHTSSAETDNATVAVYVDDGDGVPDSGDSRVGYANITGSSVGWLSNTISGAASCASAYWILIFPDTTKWRSAYTSNVAKTLYYQTNFTYGSPPATLNGTWSTTGGRDYSVYISIGN